MGFPAIFKKNWERVVDMSCWSRAAVVTRCSYTDQSMGFRYIHLHFRVFKLYDPNIIFG